MKKLLIIGIVFLFMVMPFRVSAQAQEMQQLLLNIEKLAQFKQILQDMKKGYEILNGGYNIVKDLSEGNFNLHETFLDALMQVSPTVRKYKRIGDIINYQILLVKEYKSAFKRFSKNNLFEETEIEYVEKVYSTLFKELATVITANKLRMSDDERLESIDRIYADMQDKLVFLRSFNTTTSVLAVQRAKEQKDVHSLQMIYKVQP